MMKLTEDGKRTIEQLHILSGESLHQSKLFLTHLASVFIMDYLNGNSTTIPYFGEIKIIHKEDVVTPLGKEAVVEIEFTPDAYLKKTVGQIADGVEIETEVEKTLKSLVTPRLTDIIEPK